MKLDIKEIAKKNTNKKQIVVKPLAHVDNYEKEMENFLLYVSETISKRFKNKVLKQLDKKTIEKFTDSDDYIGVVTTEIEISHNSFEDFKDSKAEWTTKEVTIPCKLKDLHKEHQFTNIKRLDFTDAQTGNYAVIYARLVKDFQRSIKKQFSEKRIKKYVQSLYNRIDKANSKSFYGNVGKEVGVDVKKIIKTDGLNFFKNAKQLETNLQIGKTLNDQMENLTTNMLRLMSAGQNLESLYKEVENITGKNKNKSKLVARNELATFNTQLSKKRADNLDIKMRKWNTVGDERTRKCHQARDGKLYPVDGKLYSSCDGESLEVGESVNCRCYDTFVIDLE